MSQERSLSMSETNVKISISDTSLEQAITDIIESLAIEGISLSNILDSESEIIIKAKSISKNIDDYVSVNQSVNNVIKNVFRLQLLMQFELDSAEDLLEKIKDYYEFGEMEE